MRTLFLGVVAAGCAALFVWISGFLLPRETAALKRGVRNRVENCLKKTAQRLSQLLQKTVLEIESPSNFIRAKRNASSLMCCFLFEGGKQVFPPPPAAGSPPPSNDHTETLLAQKAEMLRDEKTLSALFEDAQWVETVLAAARLLGRVKDVKRWTILPPKVAFGLLELKKAHSWKQKMNAALETAKALWRWRPKIWSPLARQVEKILQDVLANAPLLEDAAKLEELLLGLKMGRQWAQYSELAKNADEGFSKTGKWITLCVTEGGKRRVGVFDASALLERYMENAATALGDMVRLRLGEWEFSVAVREPVFETVGAKSEGLMELERARIRPIKAALFGSAAGLVAALFGLWLMLQRRANEAYERSRFLSAIGHELKTPLTTIRMFAEMLAGGRYRDASEMERLARVVGGQAAALSRQIENLLLFSRMERGAFVFRFTNCVVDDVVREAVAEFAPVADVEGARLNTTLNCPMKITADANALKEAVLNLISNAVKFTRGKPKEVFIRTGVNGREIFIEVEDRGEGIPPEFREKIFKEYWRVEGEGRPGGAGLGLALVRRIVAAHKGRIELESVVAKGSLFRIILPAE